MGSWNQSTAGERIHEQAFTDGEGGCEAEVWRDFDEVFRLHERWFRVLPEVTGWYVGPRPHILPKQPRIDRILLPSRELMAAGWRLGPVGVECKRKGEKIGPAICQALDYSHAVFPISGGCTVALEWIFIWPIDKVTGDIASIMSQNRIGCARSWNGVDIQLKTDSLNILEATPGNITRISTPRCGYKVGSR